jgi:soluble cytochrome b562
MILKQDSIIRYLPIDLEKRQFVILDSIRFSLEMIDNSWLSLIHQIHELSQEKYAEAKDFPKLFKEAWSIIDNTQRLIKLHGLLKIKNQKNLMNEIAYIKDFRHTFQHLDERIDEALLNFDFPIYGILTWNYLNLISGNIDIFITSSGITREDISFPFDTSKFDRNKSLDNITLETVVRVKGQFIRKQLDLTLLIEKLESIITSFENDLEQKFIDLDMELADWKSRKDIVLRIENK